MTHQEAVGMLAASRYLLDDMPDADRQAFEDHFFSCDLCADDLRITAAMLQGAREGFAAPSPSAHVLPMAVNVKAPVKSAWYRSAALPWAAAATLALVAAYQSFWVVPSLRRDSSPLALVPITLRPASRGVEPTIVRGTSAVTLAVEINEPTEHGELTYVLGTSDGRQIVSGRAAAPAPGTPLLLLMPSWTLVGPIHYILSVHDTGPSGRSLGEYRFAVSQH